MDMQIRANEGKHLTIAAGGVLYARIPVKTHIITARTSSRMCSAPISPILHSREISSLSPKRLWPAPSGAPSP
jgi:hypothetical protein